MKDTMIILLLACCTNNTLIFCTPPEGERPETESRILEEETIKQEQERQEQENRNRAAALEAARRTSAKQNKSVQPPQTLGTPPIHELVINTLYDTGVTFSNWFSSGVESAKTTASSWMGIDRTSETTQHEDKTTLDKDTTFSKETETQRLQRRLNRFSDPMSLDHNILDLEVQLEVIKTDPTNSSFFEKFLQQARDVQTRFTKTVEQFKTLSDTEKTKQAPKLAGQGLDILDSLEKAAEHATTSILSQIKAISANVVIATGIVLFDAAAIITGAVIGLLPMVITLTIALLSESGGMSMPIFFSSGSGGGGFITLADPTDPKFYYNLSDPTSHLNKTEAMTAAAAIGSMEQLHLDPKRQEQMKTKATQYLKELFEITPKDAAGKLQLKAREFLRVKTIIDTLAKLDPSIPKSDYLNQLSSGKPVAKK